jgi:hypothetical protein
MYFVAPRNEDRENGVPRRPANCLACGGAMAPCLVRAASPRCHDCREQHAPLRADLVEPPPALPARSDIDTGRDARLAA